MSGRGRGRGGRGGRFNRSRGAEKAQSTIKKESKSAVKKNLADYVYYIGSAKQASVFVTTTEFIINHIRKTYTNGDDIGDALEARQETDMLQYMPALNVSVDDDDEVFERENKQFEILYEAEIQDFVTRKRMYETNRGKAYAMIFSQCSKALQNKIQPNRL